MSDERTNASVKRDHIALMNTLFRWDPVAQKYIAQPEVFFSTPNIEVNMGNFVGALNKADSEQWPPNPGDPLARMRAAPGQLAKWATPVVTNDEVEAMGAIYGTTRVAQQLAFYGVGNPGNINVRQTGASTYDFVDNNVWVQDVNGAGDALVAKNAATSGVSVIAPLSP